MSYCVNCGVELGEAEKSCPLCKTPVVNPVNPWKEPEKKPYPERVDQIMKIVDYKFGVRLASLLLLLPAAISVLCNIAVNRALTWSVYVVGALCCVYVFVLLPLLFRKIRPYMFQLFDFAATSLYVLMIAAMNGGFGWYLRLALPLIATVYATASVLTFVFRRRKAAPLRRAAAASLIVGLAAVLFEVLLDLFISGFVRFDWALYVLIVGAVFAAVFALIESKKRWKDEIRRRLFY